MYAKSLPRIVAALALSVFIGGPSKADEGTPAQLACHVEGQAKALTGEIKAHFRAAPQYGTLVAAACNLERRAGNVRKLICSGVPLCDVKPHVDCLEDEIERIEDLVDDVPRCHVTKQCLCHVEKLIGVVEDGIENLEDVVDGHAHRGRGHHRRKHDHGVHQPVPPVYHHEPVYRGPVHQEPIYQEPIYQEPNYQEPVYRGPVIPRPQYPVLPPAPRQNPVYEEPVQVYPPEQTYPPRQAYPALPPQHYRQGTRSPYPTTRPQQPVLPPDDFTLPPPPTVISPTSGRQPPRTVVPARGRDEIRVGPLSIKVR